MEDKIAEVQQDVPDEQVDEERSSITYPPEPRDELGESDRQETAGSFEPMTRYEAPPSATYEHQTISALYSNEPSDSSIAPPEHVLDEFELLAIREGFANLDEPASELDTAGDEPLLPETGIRGSKHFRRIFGNGTSNSNGTRTGAGRTLYTPKFAAHATPPWRKSIRWSTRQHEYAGRPNS